MEVWNSKRKNKALVGYEEIISCLYKIMIIYGFIKGKRQRHWLILGMYVISTRNKQ